MARQISAAEYKKIRHLAAIKSWQTRRRNAQAKAAGAKTGRLERMKTLDPLPGSISELKGGISNTYTMTLADGSKAVFRVGRAAGAVSDAASWIIAEAGGVGDMVPAAAVRQLKIVAEGFNPATGALCEWQEGTPASMLPEAQWYGDSQHDLRRAGMFDFMSGNGDRHEGNWVVDGGTLRLIDHNLTMGAHPASMILDMLARGLRDNISPTELKALVKPYEDSVDRVVAKLSSLRATHSEGPWVGEEAKLYPDQIRNYRHRVRAASIAAAMSEKEWARRRAENPRWTLWEEIY